MAAVEGAAAGGAIGGAIGGSSAGPIGAVAGLIIGGGISVGSYLYGQGELDKQLRDEIKRQKQLRDMNLAMLDLNFEVDKENSLKAADVSDAQTTQQESLVGLDINNQIDALRIGQEQQVFDFNQQAIQAGQSEGAALSQMAASGTRGSTMSDAVEMQSAMNSQQLQLNEDNARAGTDLSFARIMNSLADNVFTMQANRNAAMDTRKAYDDGSTYGTQGNQYKQYISKRIYNETQYNNYIKDLQDQLDDVRDWKKNLLGAVGAFFTGATNGMNTGKAVGETYDYIYGGLKGGNKNVTYSWNTVGGNAYNGSLA